MDRVVSQQDVVGAEGKSEIDCMDKADEEKYGVQCTVNVKHIERDDQLYVARMMSVVERG